MSKRNGDLVYGAHFFSQRGSCCPDVGPDNPLQGGNLRSLAARGGSVKVYGCPLFLLVGSCSGAASKMTLPPAEDASSRPICRLL